MFKVLLVVLLAVSCASAADPPWMEADAAPLVPTRGTRTQAMTTPEVPSPAPPDAAPAPDATVPEAADAVLGPEVAALDMGAPAMGQDGPPAPDASGPSSDMSPAPADATAGTDANDAGDQRHHVLGQWCTRDFQCLSGFCTGTGVTIGICCESACTGECHACNASGICKRTGSRTCHDDDGGM